MAPGTGMTGKAWVDEAYKESPWQNFLSGAILDPTNLVGFGLPGMGAKAALKAPLLGKQLSTGLKAANVVDQLPGQVTGKAIDLGMAGGRKALGTVADAVGPMIPNNAGTQAIGKAYTKTLQGWRENALLSPAFHVNNYLGNVMLALQHDLGSNNWDVVRAAVQAPFKGRDQGVTDMLGRLGNNRTKLTYPPGSTPPPIDPDSFPARWTQETGKLGREPNINNPLSTPSVFRDIPDTVAPANWARDKLSDLSEMSKKFGSNRIEGPGIDAAFKRTFAPKFRQTSDEFYKELQKFRDPFGGRATEVTNAINEFKRVKGQMSPDDLRELLQPGTRARRAAWAAGGTPATVNKIGGGMPAGVSGNVKGGWQDQLVKNWEDKIIESMQAGTKNSTDTFFDYTANNPIDVIGQNTLGFHRFAINNLPKSIKAAGKNPLFSNVPVEYYRASDQYNEQKGLPRAFHGKMPIGPAVPGVGQFTADPMGVLPLGSLVKAATRPSSTLDDKGTFIGDAADDLRGLGLGLNPFIDALLTVTGQHGRSFAPSFLRASQPVNGILSAAMGRPVDIEGGSKDFFGGIQEELTGQAPFPYQQYLLRKRQAELKALGKDPATAASDVGDQMGVEGVGGFMGIPGLKLLTPEEQEARKASQLARAMYAAGNKNAYRDNPAAGAYADLDPRAEQVRNWKNLSAADRSRLLRDPEVRDELLDKLAMQLHNGGSNGGSNGTVKSPNPLISMQKIKGATERATEQRPTGRFSDKFLADDLKRKS